MSFIQKWLHFPKFVPIMESEGGAANMSDNDIILYDYDFWEWLRRLFGNNH